MGSKASAKSRRSPSASGPFAGRYELLRPLGQGGGGTVFLARDLRRDGQEVALKILDRRRSKDPALAAAMQNEFAALALLRHRNLAQVHDFGATREEMFFSSEYVPGEDLLSAARGADLNTVFRLVVELLRALDYLHRRGVLHLDLKPENILVAKPEGGERGLKLIDFGLAEWKRRGVSGPGEFSGTPPYAAPELLLEQGAGPASDIYALGMLFHRLFAKEFPFPSQDPLAMMQAQVSGPPRRAQGLNPALPEAFSDLLFKMVAKDARDRFASIPELLTAINAVLEENFSLRGAAAPAAVLEESDHSFRRPLLDRLAAELQSSAPRRLAIVGGPGLGKSRLLRRLKELLQLAGRHPLYFADAVALNSAAAAAVPLSAGQAVLVDGAEADLPLSPPTAAWLDSAPGPVLLAAETPEAPPSGFQAETLQPLTEAELAEFLRSEIQDLPLPAASRALCAQSAGRADRLEDLLQALREEGLLQWGDAGWRWTDPEAAVPEDLLQRQARRWEERRSQLLEILKLSPLGLGVETLAGLLGVSPSVLRPRLQAWTEASHLRRREEAGEAAYGIPEAREAAAARADRDWPGLRFELERHYARGEFALGAQIASLLEQANPDRETIPPLVRILAARHYAAAGRNEAALALLPASGPPTPAEEAGLYWEVRARAQLSLGKLEAAEQALTAAQEAYQKIPEASGLSRVHNLRGLAENRLGRREAAVACFERAIEAARSAQDPYAQGLAEMNLGNAHHDAGRLEEARAHYERALRSADAAGHPLLRLKLLRNRVNLLYTMGRAADAEAGAYDLLRQALRADLPEDQAAALNFLSLFAGQRGDFEAQRRRLDQAIALLEARGASPLLPQLYFNRAYLNWDAKKFPAAQLDAEAALALAERLANPFLEAWSRLALGKILRDRAKPDLAAARTQLETARSRMEEHQLQHLLWEADFDLGLLEKRAGDPAAALARFARAKASLEVLLPQLPEGQRQSYLRDRKLEKILEAMEDL